VKTDLRIRLHLPALIIVLGSFQVGAQDFTYTTNNGTITLTGYTGPGGDVVIPSMIDGLPVTSISDQVFFDSFLGNTGPTSVTIPNSVTNIGHRAFKYCITLSAITVDALNPTYASVDGVLFSKSQTTLIRFPAGKTVTSYTIPESVNSIGDDALEYCTRLTSITIPGSVTSIGTNAFSSCWGLTTITLPQSVSDIADAEFSYCHNLTNVTIPNSVTNIGTGAFQSCSSLISVTIPDSITHIGDNAFDECTGLTSVMLRNGISSIGDQTFNYCFGLTNVTIPASITNIGVGPFARCTSLIAINVEPLNPSYSSVDGVLFNKNQTTLVQYPGDKAGSYTIPGSLALIGDYTFTGCTKLTSVTIPNGVPSIGISTFDTCTSLTSVNIPSSVTNIGDAAFLNCQSLTNVTIPYRVSTIGSYAFFGCTNMAMIYFMGDAPSLGQYVFDSAGNTTAYYLPGTTGWGPTFGGIPTAQWTLPYPLILSSNLGIQSNQFGFTVSWATNLSVVVEASQNPANRIWQPLQSNNLTSGSFYFSDPQWTNYPSRFYRVRWP
jgi:hypothetical protein